MVASQIQLGKVRENCLHRKTTGAYICYYSDACSDFTLMVVMILLFYLAGGHDSDLVIDKTQRFYAEAEAGIAILSRLPLHSGMRRTK